jgi:aspartate aminotransferase-like enzyme/phosphoglycerate dehydrogenase-like enzyme
MPNKLIMTADLSNLSPTVAAHVKSTYGHHRAPWFDKILEYITKKFSNYLGSGFKPLILTCSGLGAKESLFSNLVNPADKVWISKNSDLEKLAESWKADAKVLNQDEWMTEQKNLPKIIFIEHVSNSGKLLNLTTISKRIKALDPKILIVVDLSTSFGADKINIPNTVDAIIIIPERSLMGIPGLSIVAVNDTLLDAINTCRNDLPEAPYLLDLIKANKVWEKKHTTPYSPNISSCVALHKSLEVIDNNGSIAKHVDRHIAWASLIRKTLSAKGLKLIQDNSTNAFTVFDLPDNIKADTVVEMLIKQGIIIEKFSERKNSIKMGHLGYLNYKLIHRFIETFQEVLCSLDKKCSREVSYESIKKDIEGFELKFKETGSNSIFSIPPNEFIEKAIKKSKAIGPNAASKVEDSARKLFSSHNYGDYLKDRVIGFIGAGNIVRSTCDKCLEIGIKNIIVYSPSLAALKKNDTKGKNVDNHKTLEYWEKRNINVATSPDEVYMNSHTVVLLPTVYTKEALQLFQKPITHLNENIIDRDLLQKIKVDGKMDLLINASARSQLVDRKALSDSLEEGWLIYCSDETPLKDDPLLKYDNAMLTAHVGGSGKLAQKKVALNTNKILTQVIKQMITSEDLQLEFDPEYTLSLMNDHLNKNVWRSKLLKHPLKEIKILITDPFNIPSLDFKSLEKLGTKINVKDISGNSPTEEILKENIGDFRPNILMVRSRTKITESIMETAKTVPEFAAIVRPGVGVDNIYSGMALASELGIQIINEPFGNSFAIAEMTMHFILNGISRVLLTPGPTQFKEEVFNVTEEYYHPSTQEFKSNYDNLLKKLSEWASCKNDAIILSGPSTGLMEASISNLTVHGSTGLIISHGKFGERFIQIAEAKSRKIKIMEVKDPEWGKVFSPEEIGDFLKTSNGSKISFLCFQQNETSSGVAYTQDQIKNIVNAARTYNPDMMIIVDAVSGMFAYSLDFDDLDIDAMIFGSQKGLGISSGIAYMVLSDRALNKTLKNNSEEFEKEQKVFYLSLPRLLKTGKFDDMPNIFHIMSTLKSLEIMESEGGKKGVEKRHEFLAELCREEISKMGLKMMSHSPYLSNSVTSVILPEWIKAKTLRNSLESLYGISIAGAQGDYWKENAIRIGHLGFVYKHDLVRCLRAMRIIINDLK